jgi:hypothetical protein
LLGDEDLVADPEMRRSLIGRRYGMAGQGGTARRFRGLVSDCGQALFGRVSDC